MADDNAAPAPTAVPPSLPPAADDAATIAVLRQQLADATAAVAAATAAAAAASSSSTPGVDVVLPARLQPSHVASYDFADKHRVFKVLSYNQDDAHRALSAVPNGGGAASLAEYEFVASAAVYSYSVLYHLGTLASALAAENVDVALPEELGDLAGFINDCEASVKALYDAFDQRGAFLAFKATTGRSSTDAHLVPVVRAALQRRTAAFVASDQPVVDEIIREFQERRDDAFRRQLAKDAGSRLAHDAAAAASADAPRPLRARARQPLQHQPPQPQYFASSSSTAGQQKPRVLFGDRAAGHGRGRGRTGGVSNPGRGAASAAPFVNDE